jgi:hypothetical protein
MAALTRKDDRLTADLIATCRSHFCGGRGVEDVAAAVRLDVETVRRIHDVHMGLLRPQVDPARRGKYTMRKDRSSEGRRAEHLARVEMALQLVESGFGVELAVEVSGAETDAVASLLRGTLRQ